MAPAVNKENLVENVAVTIQHAVGNTDKSCGWWVTSVLNSGHIRFTFDSHGSVHTVRFTRFRFARCEPAFRFRFTRFGFVDRFVRFFKNRFTVSFSGSTHGLHDTSDCRRITFDDYYSALNIAGLGEYGRREAGDE